MKNVFAKSTFLKTSDANTTTALSTYSTPYPLCTPIISLQYKELDLKRCIKFYKILLSTFLS